MKLQLALALAALGGAAEAKGSGEPPSITMGDEFKVVNEAPYRAEFGNKSEKLGTVKVGTIVTAVEARPNSDGSGRLRIKIVIDGGDGDPTTGWINEATKKGKANLEAVAKPEAKDAPAEAVATSGGEAAAAKDVAVADSGGGSGVALLGLLAAAAVAFGASQSGGSGEKKAEPVAEAEPVAAKSRSPSPAPAEVKQKRRSVSPRSCFCRLAGIGRAHPVHRRSLTALCNQSAKASRSPSRSPSPAATRGRSKAKASAKKAPKKKAASRSPSPAASSAKSRRRRSVNQLLK